MDVIVKNHPLYGNFKVIKNDKGISQHIINSLTWETHILDILSKYIKPNTIFIDIGANIGCHSIGMLKKHNDIKVVAFEPQPFMYNLLTYNLSQFEANKYICHDCGLSDKDDVIYSTMPNYITDENPGGFGLQYNRIQTEDTISVQIKQLDSFKYSNVSLIKIDVEGHENEVLTGSVETIKINKPIMIIEILGGTPYANGTHEQKQYITNTIKYIESLEYSVSLISYSDYLCIPI